MPDVATPSKIEVKGLPPQGLAPMRNAPPQMRLQIAEQLKQTKANPYPGEWTLMGPYNGGRITDLEMHPNDSCVIYAGAASGGVFKSCDCGENWLPIFDQMPVLTIGDLAIDPHDSNILYAGTGEINAGGGSFAYDGLGIYKSDNGGASWQNIGLEKSGGIGRIAVHPQHSDTIYAAAMGSLFANNKERGVFRSTNGGKKWKNVLHLNDSTGCADIIMHPKRPQIVYAVMWGRTRRANHRNYGGETSGIYRSKNGGESWERLHDGLPVSNNIGRIALAAAPSQANTMYAAFADAEGLLLDVYKSENGGENWQQTPTQPPKAMWDDYGWWFGKIWVSPQSPNKIYLAGIDLYASPDGGESWRNVSYPNVHVDQHALCFNPLIPNQIFVGNDGGVYRSDDEGKQWQKTTGLPITQIYKCTTHPLYPNRMYCGTQDNGILQTHSPEQRDWEQLVDGDFFGIHINPRNPSKLLALREYGNLTHSPDGGQTFVFEDFEFGRCNWNTPLISNPCNSQTLYLGANKLWQSKNGGDTWQTLSPELSGLSKTGNYGTITAIAISPSKCEVIYAGTDNGLLWKSRNAGAKWELIADGLPKKWITALAAHSSNWQVLYVGFSGYREGEKQAYIYKTESAGKTWASVSGSLPPVAVNDILLHPQQPDICFAATDGGVFISKTGGYVWQALGGGLPPAPVTHLLYHPIAKRLYAATYGRSLYQMPLW